MSHFVAHGPLTVAAWKRDDGTPIWITSESFTFVYCTGETFTVPRGYETDLGTIPFLLRWLFNPSDPRRARAYVTHDFANTVTAGRPPGAGVVSSQAACGVLYDALRIDGDAVWSCMLHFLGVFLGIAKRER